MKKLRLIKLLMLTILLGAGAEAFADTQAVMTVRTTVPQAASISRYALATPAASVSPTTGTITGSLGATFTLDSNDAENEMEFVITSSAETSEGTVSAYDNIGNILFTNISNLPTGTDVSQAKAHTGANNNVIAYPVTLTTTSPLTSSFKTGYKEFGHCYVIDMQGETEGNITFDVGPSPVAGTFSTTRDTSGTYQAVITITAANK